MAKSKVNSKGTGTSQQNTGMPKPEIRSNPHSRKNEEYDYQGDNITHHLKQQRHEPIEKI